MMNERCSFGFVQLSTRTFDSPCHGRWTAAENANLRRLKEGRTSGTYFNVYKTINELHENDRKLQLDVHMQSQIQL